MSGSISLSPYGSISVSSYGSISLSLWERVGVRAYAFHPPAHVMCCDRSSRGDWICSSDFVDYSRPNKNTIHE